MNYVEEFSILEELGKYGIVEGGTLQVKPTYTTWCGGCAIHKPFDTIQEARQYIFDHATYQLQIRADGARARIVRLEQAAKALQKDVFNLAKFKL